jgi:hypothetical protein
MKLNLLLLAVLVFSACAPSPTQEINGIPYYPLDTRTGIEDVDVILEAVEADDMEQLRSLIHYTTVGCLNVDALGGPPRCRDGEAAGTLVEALPFIGPEGGFLRKDEIENWPGPEVVGIYAVYRVSGSVFSEEYYPAGEYGIFLLTDDGNSAMVLQVKDAGIVRIDYIFDPTTFPEVLQRDASEIILGPESR